MRMILLRLLRNVFWWVGSRQEPNPDPDKRYLLIQKQVHPDTPTGSTELSTQVNVAKETLDRLYEDPIQQITLFQTVFSVIQKESIPKTVVTNHPHQGTAPYIILYLVGAGLGTILVLRWANKKKSETK